MLLKALLVALASFAAAVGLLRISVLYENYALLGLGLVLALGAVVVGMQKDKGAAAA